MWRNCYGENRLHLACKEKNCLEKVKQFISEGDDINLQDNHVWTPLHETVNDGHSDMCTAPKNCRPGGGGHHIEMLFAKRGGRTIMSYTFHYGANGPRARGAVRRRLRENEIANKLGEYLLKGYCMLFDACQVCNCILLRTPDHQLFCVVCHEMDIENKKTSHEEVVTTNMKKDDIKRSTKQKNKEKLNENMSNCYRLENKLKWAVDELTKTRNPNRINKMCKIITKLAQTIKVLKIYEMTSVED
ncbi:unnamed protein product [Rotaria sp. Silwood2]|nr:unnamed protein product [Rotaria sp. Silwood2]